MQLHLHIPAGSVRLAWRLASVWIGLLVLFVISSHGARLQASVAAQEMEEPVHVVAAGETLSEIAQSYDVPMGDVMRLNGISDADAIYVGQHLRIPAALDAITVSEPVDEDTADTEVAANEDTGVEVANAAISTVAITSLNPTYTVRIGDTIPGIALRYDLSVAALRSVNGLAPGDPLRAGQALILPATRDELQFSPAPIRYTVQPGDSLGLIAQQHGTTLNALMTLNRISNPDLIQPGQDLLLPASSSSEPAPQIGPVQSGFYYHTVRAGETPSELAQQFNSTPQALVRYNGLPDVATLYAGLEVRIPYG
ncbi:MAG: LysM peptidoglycan-binding domain-containing protein, partial [Caldilineaceae bacterium]|nr:LysM peptidoglycan-binding domain-containing protein [Caldilineaceae bacterium]